MTRRRATSPPPSPPLSPPPPSPSPPRPAELGTAGAAAVIGGYLLVVIVIIAIVKIYLCFRNWDRVEFCRVLRRRVLSSCVECVDNSRRESEGRASRADQSDPDDAYSA